MKASAVAVQLVLSNTEYELGTVTSSLPTNTLKGGWPTPSVSLHMQKICLGYVVTQSILYCLSRLLLHAVNLTNQEGAVM